MRNLTGGIVATALIATLIVPAYANDGLSNRQQRVRAAIEACMLKAKPRPFMVANSQSWNDFTYVGESQVETFNDEATKWYREVCLPTITATLAALGGG